MDRRVPPVSQLCQLQPGEEAIFFALLSQKIEATTRDGKPFFKVVFRDAKREVSTPIWFDSPWFEQCRKEWTPGCFYKLQAVYQISDYGPQLEIRRIRPVSDKDRQAGFDPLMLLPRSDSDPVEVFQSLLEEAKNQIEDSNIRKLVTSLLVDYKPQWLVAPAARRHHHAYVGGLLEHTLSVTKLAKLLAEHFCTLYPQLEPPLDKDLVIAGAILHDIGKLREIELETTEPRYTAEGELLGHILLGRDMVREAARQIPLDPEKQLKLEHIIVSHQRLPEWGSPKPPMTPEALIVHYADDADAKMRMFFEILSADSGSGIVTSDRNLLRQRLYKGRSVTNDSST